MPDVTPHQPRADAPSRRRLPARASEGEIRAAAERAARLPDGLAILRDAPLECAAVLLGLDPLRLEQVRAALADPAVLSDAIRAHALAAEARRARPGAAPPEPAAPAPRDPAELLEAARRREDGLRVVLEASAESAAVLFGVHPGMVLRARELAARGGAPPAA